MSSVSRPCSFFLLLLLCVKGNFARLIEKEAAKNIETAYDSQKRDDPYLNHALDDNIGDDDHSYHQEIHSRMYAHTLSSTIHKDHMDPSLNVFFHIEDLKVGKKLPLYFPINNPSTTPHIIPKEEADSIPFSQAQLPQILQFFQFPQDSYQAKAIKDTLTRCELPPTKGETKICATSLESMLDNLTQIFGLDSNSKVLTTTQLRNRIPHLQNYTILKDPEEICATKVVSCHPMPYPYAVFYCHGQKSDSKLFVLSLKGENDGVNIDAIGICHMDTWQWDPHHASFRVLRIEPGTSPVCHVFPQDTLIWVSPPSPVN